MREDDWLAEQFEENRTHLQAVAYRILGSVNEAEDAVQEAWLRLSRSDTSDVENLGGWLTTVVSRVCLDLLRARRTRREEPVGADCPEPIMNRPEEGDPERDVLLADAVGPALLVVLEKLAPAERVAFVLHDMFAVPFDEITLILERSPDAARQLASRARRWVQGTTTGPGTDLTRQREIVDAFLAASRDGDLEALLAVLDPDVVLRADRTAVRMAASIGSRRRTRQGPSPPAPSRSLRFGRLVGRDDDAGSGGLGVDQPERHLRAPFGEEPPSRPQDQRMDQQHVSVDQFGLHECLDELAAAQHH
jgi:RNA polymerase sigma factor (sigma-70 family)